MKLLKQSMHGEQVIFCTPYIRNKKEEEILHLSVCHRPQHRQMQLTVFKGDLPKTFLIVCDQHKLLLSFFLDISKTFFRISDMVYDGLWQPEKQQNHTQHRQWLQ